MKPGVRMGVGDRELMSDGVSRARMASVCSCQVRPGVGGGVLGLASLTCLDAMPRSIAGGDASGWREAENNAPGTLQLDIGVTHPCTT